jgi:hypothetical protein
MKKLLISALLAFAPVSTSALASYEAYGVPTTGWYVVAGSYKSGLREEAIYNSRRVEAAAQRCGFTVQHINSNDTAPALPGRIMQVVGPYRSYGSAQIAKARLQRCVPDAFVKELMSLEDAAED